MTAERPATAPQVQPVTPEQRRLDQAIRAAIRRDDRIGYALAYGSFTQGAADAFSDLEYYVFLPETELARFDVRAWLEATAPVRHFVVNDFGTPNAVLDSLLRVELHAEADTRLDLVRAWPGSHVHPEAMLIKDTAGRLAAHLQALASKALAQPAAEAEVLFARLLNWLVFGLNVLARGERVRALELLGWIQGGLLRLARLHEGQTGHWLNASRLAEWELSAGTLRRYARVTAGLDELEQAYAAAWAWIQELAGALPASARGTIAPELAQALEQRLASLRASDSSGKGRT